MKNPQTRFHFVFLCIISGLLLATSLSLHAQVTIVKWNFEDDDLLSDGGLPANDNIAFGTTGTNFPPFTSSVNCDQEAICNGWEPDDAWVTASFSTQGYNDIQVSFEQARFQNGPAGQFQVQYSLDGFIWTYVGGQYTPPRNDNCSPWFEGVRDLPFLADNQANVYIRWLNINGTSSGGNNGMGGGSRMDNIVVRAFDAIVGNCFLFIDTVETVNATCGEPNGRIEVEARCDFCESMGDELEYSINEGASWQDSEIFENVAAGEYRVEIRQKNSNECRVDYVENPVVIRTTDAEARFNQNKDRGCAPLKVSFTDNSRFTGGSSGSWKWFFGDGDSSTLQNPMHTYDSFGKYDVMLIVTGDNNCIDTIVKKNLITVDTSYANFIADMQTVACGNNVKFTNRSQSSASIFDYKWRFGDGKMSDSENPNHRYDSVGVFDVFLKVSGQFNCMDDTTFSAYITVIDTVPPVISCPNDTTVRCNTSLDPARLGMATATDDCGVDTIVFYDDTLDQSSSFSILRTFVAFDHGNNSDTCTQEITLVGAVLKANVLLSGPMGIGSTPNSLMWDSLRTKGLIPLTEPYGANNEFISDPASVLGNQGAQSVVDWVLIQLRDKDNPAVILSERAALLQRDGQVVDTNGRELIYFDTMHLCGIDSVYVAVQHRNHLGAMTAQAWHIDILENTVDFTDVNASFFSLGFAPQDSLVSPNVYALWPGNAEMNQVMNKIQSPSDPGAVQQEVLSDPQNLFMLSNYHKMAYGVEDVNMDGSVIFAGQDNDIDVILDAIYRHPQNTDKNPDFMIPEQLPNP